MNQNLRNRTKIVPSQEVRDQLLALFQKNFLDDHRDVPPQPFRTLGTGTETIGIDDHSDWRWSHYYHRPLDGLRAVVSIDLLWADEIRHDAFIAFMQDHGPNALRRKFDTIELHVKDEETAALARLAL